MYKVTLKRKKWLWNQFMKSVHFSYISLKPSFILTDTGLWVFPCTAVSHFYWPTPFTLVLSCWTPHHWTPSTSSQVIICTSSQKYRIFIGSYHKLRIYLNLEMKKQLYWTSSSELPSIIVTDHWYGWSYVELRNWDKNSSFRRHANHQIIWMDRSL